MTSHAAPFIQSSTTSPDPARQVQIDFDLQYVECDLADERFENHPVVQLYLSRQFDRRATTGGQVSIPLDEHHLGKVYSGTLSGTLSRKHNGIPSMSAIGIRSYAQHREDHGHPCFVNVGTSHAYMGNVISEYQQKGSYNHKHDLLMRTTVVGVNSQVKKGVVRIKVKAIRVGHGINGLDDTASPLQAPIAQTEQLLSSYIQQTIQIEQQLPDVIDGMSRIRAPMDISQEGIESTGDAFLPIAAFAMREIPETNEAFYENALTMVMRRRNMQREQFKTLSQHEKVRLLGCVLGHAVQSFDYIGDAVELSNRNNPYSRRQKVGDEEFSDAFFTIGGDCEDTALSTYINKQGFENTPLVNKDLKELQRLSKKYVSLLTLAVVHGAKAGDHTEQVGAHMYHVMVPEHQMREGLQRTGPGRQMLAQMGPMEAYKGKSPFVNASTSGARSTHATTLKNLPPISVEGTGVIDPLGYKDPIIEKRRYLAQHMTAYTWAKTEIPHEEQGESGFYYVDVSGVTSHYIDQGVNIGSFWYGTVDPEHHQYTGMKRGVLYTDRLKDSNRFALMPQPPMSKQIMDVIEAANALQPPPRPLTLHYDQDMGPDTHPLLDDLCQHVESLGRDASGAGTDSVDLYILPSQLTRQEIEEMKSNANEADRLVKAAYVKENVTNDIWIYRVQLYIK